jgi:hypothetical protein
MDKFIVISNIELNFFQINLMLEFFLCLRLELLKLFEKKNSFKVTFFVQNFYLKIFAMFLLFTFSFEFHFFPFFF